MNAKQKVVEILGTFFLFLVIGVNCLNPALSATAHLSIGGVLVLLVYLGGSISGAQYNPAVSLGVMVRKSGSVIDFLSYSVCQLIGVALASFAVLFFVDTTAVSENDFVPSGIFAAEYLFTFLLVLTILMVATNRKNEGNSFFGLAIGLVVMVGICVVGPVSGAVFNPAVLMGLVVIKVVTAQQVFYYLVAQALAAVSAGFLGKYLLEEN